MKEIIEVLKKCLNKGNCTQCEYGEYGQPMMCCKELMKTILDKLERKENDE